MEESRVTMESGSSMNREWRTSRDPAGHGTGKRGSGVMGDRDLGSVFYLYLRGHSGCCSEVALHQSVFVLLSTKMRGAASHVEETTLAFTLCHYYCSLLYCCFPASLVRQLRPPLKMDGISRERFGRSNSPGYLPHGSGQMRSTIVQHSVSCAFDGPMSHLALCRPCKREKRPSIAHAGALRA